MTKKDKIIHAALKLFAENGYAETPVSKIAKEAGVSKSLTYTHFENKEDLLKAVMESTLGGMTDAMTSLQDMDLEGFLGFFAQNLKQQPQIIRLTTILAIHPKTPQSVKEMIAGRQLALTNLSGIFTTPKIWKPNSH